MQKCKFYKGIWCLKWSTGKGKWNTLENCRTCPQLYYLYRKGIIQKTLGGESLLVEEWVKEALKTAKEESEARRTSSEDYKELLILPQGETTVEIDTDIEPRRSETQYGDRYVLHIKSLNGKAVDMDFMVNPKSPLWLAILERVADDKPEMTIIRVGEKRETRYSIK